MIMHVRIRSLDNITDADSGNIIGAASHGHPIHASSSLKDKIVAYASIAVGVIGFAVFFYFYLTPLIKARKSAKAAKQRRVLMKPLLCSEKRQYGLEDSCSFYSSDSKELEPLVQPGRVVPKDSVVMNRARQADAPVDLEPLNVVPRTPPRYDSLPDPNLSPFSDVNASRGDFCASTPPRNPLASSPRSNAATPAGALDLSESLSSTFAISGSQDSLDRKPGESPPGSSSLHAQSGATTLSPSLSTRNPFHDMNRPRSSSLRDMVPSSPLVASGVNRDDNVTTTASTQKQLDETHASSPMYADMILPRYLRESINPTSNSKAFIRVEELEKATEEYAQVPSITALDPEKTESLPKIQSLHVRDTVLARASNYTRGLVSGSPPKLKVIGTELQFEMVKQI